MRDIDQSVAAIIEFGGELLEGLAAGPNGQGFIAQYPDGNIIEYIERAE